MAQVYMTRTGRLPRPSSPAETRAARRFLEPHDARKAPEVPKRQAGQTFSSASQNAPEDTMSIAPAFQATS